LDEIGKNRSGSADKQAPADRQLAAVDVVVITDPHEALSGAHAELCWRWRLCFPAARRLHLRAGTHGSDVTSITSGYVYPPRVGHTLLVHNSEGSGESP